MCLYYVCFIWVSNYTNTNLLKDLKANSALILYLLWCHGQIEQGKFASAF